MSHGMDQASANDVIWVWDYWTIDFNSWSTDSFCTVLSGILNDQIFLTGVNIFYIIVNQRNFVKIHSQNL